jgi:hypothetical protein
VLIPNELVLDSFASEADVPAKGRTVAIPLAIWALLKKEKREQAPALQTLARAFIIPFTLVSPRPASTKMIAFRRELR